MIAKPMQQLCVDLEYHNFGRLLHCGIYLVPETIWDSYSPRIVSGDGGEAAVAKWDGNLFMGSFLGCSVALATVSGPPCQLEARCS